MVVATFWRAHIQSDFDLWSLAELYRVFTMQLNRDRILGSKLVDVRHSAYSEAAFIREGLLPAQFRSHFLVLDSDIVLDLFTAEITTAPLPRKTMPGETKGKSIQNVLGRRVVALARDDAGTSLVILEGDIFLRDDNDGCHGNPLLAAQLRDEYSGDQLSQIVDYWTEAPINFAD